MNLISRRTFENDQERSSRHFSRPDQAMVFCYLSNIAIAIAILQASDCD